MGIHTWTTHDQPLSPRQDIEMIRPGDDEYAAAARVLFAAGSPAVVVRPRNADEVTEALSQAARSDVAVAIRSGGHSMSGHGTNDGGMVLDLARLNDIEVIDEDRRVVRIGSGATWGGVSTALAPLGWALTAGDNQGVGVGGLTLGGGIGWMVRRYGLAIDNLVGVRMVTADGRLLCASSTQNPELFWALRGGGGNFGVVVDFDFIAQPISTVHFATISFVLDDPESMFGEWRDAMRRAPDELTSTIMLMPTMGDAPPSVMLQLCYCGDRDPDPVIAPFLGLGKILQSSIGEQPYGDILEPAGPVPPGLRLVSTNALVPSLEDDVLAAIVQFQDSPAPSAVAVRSLGGAFGRVPVDATAFAHRNAEAMVVGGLMLPSGTSDREIEQALARWDEVAARGVGTYLNFQSVASGSSLAAAYPPATYSRLKTVKRTYDPNNVFAGNHNVNPR